MDMNDSTITDDIDEYEMAQFNLLQSKKYKMDKENNNIQKEIQKKGLGIKRENENSNEKEEEKENEIGLERVPTPQIFEKIQDNDNNKQENANNNIDQKENNNIIKNINQINNEMKNNVNNKEIKEIIIQKKDNNCLCYLCLLSFIILLVAFALGVMYPEKITDFFLALNKMITKKNIENKTEENLKLIEENIIDEKNESIEEEKKNEIIIGIDFGSTQSGYQIFYNSDIVLDGDNNIQNNKVFSTELIFDSYFKKGLSLGEEAKFFPKEKIEKENKLYFSKFKRNLDPKNKNNMANASIPIGGQLENDIVVKEFLRLIKDYIIKNVDKIDYSNIKDVKWVLTVPPLWDDNTKKRMKDIALKAEMSNVQIALEPEVASLAIFYDKNIKKELLKPGTSFMIVDMGGYTVDFTAMKILDEDKNLEQLLKPISFTYGSNLINEKIISIIEKAYNKDKLENVKKTNYQLWEKTLDEIEEKKKQINDNTANNFRISINFNDKKCNTWTDKCTLKYNNIDIPYTSQYIDIPAHLVLEIINDLTDNIVSRLKDQIMESAEQINLIIMTGGFSNNIILREKINKYLKTSHKVKIFLDEPEKTVMKGSALFGIKPNQILKRIMPVSIGIPLDDKTFFTFVQRSQSVETDKTIEINMIPFEDKIQVYYNNENEEINEKNKILLDEIEIPSSDDPLSERKITISMTFSSYISVKLSEEGFDEIEPKILYYPS